jgi:hypothetical protein
MTRDQQLADIRAACIKANPSILELEEMSGLRIERPIRLADVLLAIELSVGSNITYYSADTRGCIYGTIELDPVQLNNFPGVDHFIKHIPGPTWNLRKDDLTEQSDECVAFLAQLLE